MLLRRDIFRRLCRARQLLGEVREQQLSIKDIAREVRISPFHFIRRFEALFGLTPHQYRIQSRVEQAKLLLATGRSVTEACMEVGFASLGTFSDLFARRIGATPSAYRNRAREAAPEPGALPQDLFPGCLSLMGCLPACAFRNFQEASAASASLEYEASLREGAHADQAHQHHGRRSGQGS